MTSNPEESLSSIDQENEYSPPQQHNPVSDIDENRKLNVASLELEPDAISAKVDKTGNSRKVPLLLSDTLNPKSSQLFVIRPLQNLSGDKSNKHEGIERRQSIGSTAAPCDHLGCCRDDASLQQELAKEKEILQNELARANMELNAKEIEFENRVAALNQNYGSSINEMKILLASQRKLGNRWKEEMSALTQMFETTIRDLSTENRQLKRMAEKLKADLKEKSIEAKEAKEMNGIYSAKITKMERKFKKLRDQDEESYIEMTF